MKPRIVTTCRDKSEIPEGPDSPNKKYYDPRIWLGAGEAAFTKRLIGSFEDLNCTNRNA